MIKFITHSEMEFDSREDLEKVIAMMPWTPEQKEQFWASGEHSEEDEAEIEGVGMVDTNHKFSFTEE